jgi:hypothetical protein
MSNLPPPILNYATPKPNLFLHKTTLWLLGVLVVIYVLISFSMLPASFDHLSEVAVLAFVLTICLTYLQSAYGIYRGSWRWACIALIIAYLNIALILLGFIGAIYLLATSTSRYAPLNFQMQLCMLVPSGAITAILAVLLHRLIPQLKSTQPHSPTPDPSDDTISP